MLTKFVFHYQLLISWFSFSHFTHILSISTRIWLQIWYLARLAKTSSILGLTWSALSPNHSSLERYFCPVSEYFSYRLWNSIICLNLGMTKGLKRLPSSESLPYILRYSLMMCFSFRSFWAICLNYLRDSRPFIFKNLKLSSMSSLKTRVDIFWRFSSFGMSVAP